jgi:hypothetical protein
MKPYPESHKQLKRIAYNRWKRYLREHGELIPDRCSLCHTIGPVNAHHPDYNKPLEVQWLCDSCHGEIHSPLMQLVKAYPS